MNIDVKTKKNYSFGALQKKLSGIVISTLNSLANNLNADIQTGIETGRDINGKAFKSFEDSTVKIRNMRGDGQTILFREGAGKGKLKRTRIIRPTSSKLSFEIQMRGFRGKTAMGLYIMKDSKLHPSL